ncbi:hypothetical protein C8R43DRAFT_1127699 [Mycena crocata]|nr:hypothetical protein C8R43DRAFT_1127699 [Mycena crocata]
MPGRKLREYPYSAEEDEQLAAALGGEEAVAELRALRNATGDGPWRAKPLGYCSPYNDDIRIANINDQLTVIYWGGNAAETAGLWSFQISRRRGANPRHDAAMDTPLDLAANNLRVYVKLPNARSFFREGGLITHEGGCVMVEHAPRGGSKTTTPICLPTRNFRQAQPGVVFL